MSTALATGGTGIGALASARVLVVAGSEGAAAIVEALEQRGHRVEELESLDAVGEPVGFDVIFVDSSRLDALAAARGGPPVLVLGEGEPGQADCTAVLPRSVDGSAAVALVDLLTERAQLRHRCAEFARLVEGVRDGSAFVGRSPVMRRLLGALSRAADSNATVLIEGAPGSGKSLAARIVHCKSRRGNRPLAVYEAAGLEGDLLQRVLAEELGTTMLIENVDQLPASGQQVLVRFLKERPRSAPDAPRLIVSTSVHLPELVARGAFREDLYYRLHAYPIAVPALRERIEDIPDLARALLDQCGNSASHRPAGFTPAALMLLESMSWPGNVAQLENVVRRAYLMSAGAPIDAGHLNQGPVPSGATGSTAASTDALEEVGELSEDDIRPFEEEEQRLLSRALRATRGNVRRAAQLLGIGRATLYRKIQQYRLRLQ